MEQESQRRKWFVALLVLIPLSGVILIAVAAELISRSAALDRWRYLRLEG
jgi:hypothetical protein